MSSEPDELLLEAVWLPARTVFPGEAWAWDNASIYVVLRVYKDGDERSCDLLCLDDGKVFDRYPMYSFENNMKNGAWTRIA